MNPYFKNLNKIEFVVTDACTGRCKHCSQGAHCGEGARLDPKIAARAVKALAAAYDLQTVMAFGGEPLLHSEAVYAIMQEAKNARIPTRQVITNGFFSRDVGEIRRTAERLRACGVNDLLLSVDAFHQKTIPLDVVRLFAEEAKKCDVPIRLQPAWLVSAEDENPYNLKTRALLADLADLEIPVGAGNVIFPEGNARIYLAEYFKDSVPENPYEENPLDLRCISVSANGDVLDGNLYREDLLDLMRAYTP